MFGMTHEKITDAIKKSELLKSMPDETIAFLLQKSITISKRQGDTILLTGGEVLGLYLVVSGSLGVFPQRGGKQIASLGSGDIFGEMSFLERRKASSAIVAESSMVEIVLFSNQQVTAALESNVHFAKNFYHAMSLSLSRRLRSNNVFLSEELRRGHEISTKLFAAMEDLKSAALRIAKQTEAPTAEVSKVGSFINELIKSLNSMEDKVASVWDQKHG
jgi:CRP-like cAMP-binding protein